MAATSSKVGPFKWYILHRNHLIALYLLAIYLTISLVVLYDFEPIFFAIPTLLIVLLLRVAWDQSNQILSAVGIFILGFILVSFFTSTVQTKEQRSLQLLYNYEQFKNITQLNPKIAKQGENFPSEFNVFFIETNPRREEFSSKQLCAIESAAKNNRNGHIYVLSIRSQLERQLKPLTDLYPNIILMKFMPIELFRDTPLFSWWQSGLVFKSKYSLAHISDAARLALLWKYGGIYSDLDTITIKSFEPLIEKSGVGYIYENVDSIGNGVMVFKRNHDFLMKIMHEFAANYNPYDWGANGPSMILKAIKAYCHVENVRELLDNASLCDDELSIFPEVAFYPLRYIDDEYKALFETDPSRVVDLLRKFTSSYSVHYYGFKSKDIKVSTRQNTLFGYLASCNCEFMYRHVDSNKLRFE